MTSALFLIPKRRPKESSIVSALRAGRDNPSPDNTMSEEQALDERKYCPKCGERSAVVVDSIFVEYGEWDEGAESRDFEGDVDVYRCANTTCGFAFADLTGISDSDEETRIGVDTNPRVQPGL